MTLLLYPLQRSLALNPLNPAKTNSANGAVNGNGVGSGYVYGWLRHVLSLQADSVASPAAGAGSANTGNNPTNNTTDNTTSGVDGTSTRAHPGYNSIQQWLLRQGQVSASHDMTCISEIKKGVCLFSTWLDYDWNEVGCSLQS